MKTFEVQTFGCKVNHYDSSLLKTRLNQEGFVLGGDIKILNTCAVTENATKEALKTAKKIKQKNPKEMVVVVGCGAQVDTSLYEKNPYVDLIVANSHKNSLPQILKEFLLNKQSPKVFKSNIFRTEGLYNGQFQKDENRTRVFLKIQDGCDSFCSFCIIPFARGKSQSIPIEKLVKSVKNFVDFGLEELVLTGVHIGDYSDGDKRLEDLVESILKETRIKRLRLSSLEPVELSNRLMDCYQEERMCPHFHLSIQSGSSPVLKAMRRKYGRKEVEETFSLIQKKVPHAFVGMDVIAGFPYETEDHFQETYEVLKNNFWTRIHVFPYSPRRKMAQSSFSRSVIVKRASLLRHLSDFRYEQEMGRQVKKVKKVLLFETNNQKGLSRDYWKVKLPPSAHRGEREVQIAGFHPGTDMLQGQFV